MDEVPRRANVEIVELCGRALHVARTDASVSFDSLTASFAIVSDISHRVITLTARTRPIAHDHTKWWL